MNWQPPPAQPAPGSPYPPQPPGQPLPPQAPPGQPPVPPYPYGQQPPGQPGQPGQPQAGYAQPPPKKKGSGGIIAAIVIVVVMLLVGLGAIFALAGTKKTGTVEKRSDAPPSKKIGDQGSKDEPVDTQPPEDGQQDGQVAFQDETVEEEYSQDLDYAVFLIQEYWKKELPKTYGADYREPEIKGEYLGSDNPSCGDQTFDGSGNAYYCFPDDYVAWDGNLMRTFYGKSGDASVYFILAHEWGHAIQGQTNSQLAGVQRELQADCFAGAWFSAVEKGEVVEGEVVEEGDADEVISTLYEVRDVMGTKITDAQAHGNSEQRITAYVLGRSGGADSCKTNPLFQPGAPGAQ